MKISDVIKIVEGLAPLSFQSDWDASGVQVAFLRKEAKSIAVMLDPVLSLMEKAVGEGADFILTHHPLSMKARFPDKDDHYLRILSFLLSHKIGLYSAHTSLDASPAGPAAWLAGELGLAKLRPLDPLPQACMEKFPALPPYSETSGLTYPGIGFSGDLAQPLAYAEFCTKLKQLLGLSRWLSCGPLPSAIQRVACCPGAGGGLLSAAKASGADIFITGDIKFHTAQEAEVLELKILDVGHYILEEEMMRRFALQLGKCMPLSVKFYAGKDPICHESV